MTTRVRFAPSPTGPLHIGGLRTALFNYLFAKKNNGVFVLRVEDTDQYRYVEGSEEYIQKALEWCHLVPDEGPVSGGDFGPYRQSERKQIYQKHIELLVERGKAYYAFDSNEALDQARKDAEDQGNTFRYGASNRMNFRNSLTLEAEETKNLLGKEPFVIRLKVEPNKEVVAQDDIRGTIRVESNNIDDKILMKSDGMPTYHFANVVDDHLMQISCVIRGEEWLPSLPLHQLIYDAFGWETPQFMHLPLILKPKGKGKLSKRDGEKEGFPVFPLQWGEGLVGFKERGFLPEALINYLALLGWNPGNDQELFSLEALENTFDLSGVQKGGARFDFEKAKWINHQYLQNSTEQQLLETEEGSKLLDHFDTETAVKIIALIKDRLYLLEDLKTETQLFYQEPDYAHGVWDKLLQKQPLKILGQLDHFIADGLDGNALKEACFAWSKENEIPFGVLMQSFRIAIVGKLAGPDLLTICEILGKSVTLKRIEKAKLSIINLNL